MIEERWPCPACGNRRTLRWADQRYYCFNCKHQWRAQRRHRPLEGVQTVFTPSEMMRLIAYRAAVKAGFFTDELPESITARSR